MKSLLFCINCILSLFAGAQTVGVQTPIEEQFHVSIWWWIIGVVIALAAGIGLYMLIKKNPRKDVVR